MTLPIERTRSLRWGWELLRKISHLPELPESLQVRIGAILVAYPPPGAVRSWLTTRIPRLPVEAAAAIEAAGQLFLDLQLAEHLPNDVRREVLFVRRHYPLPGATAAFALGTFPWGIDDWLGLEAESSASDGTRQCP